MAVFKLNVAAKGFLAGTYLKVVHASDNGQQWQLQSIHHDDNPEVQHNSQTRFFQRSEVTQLLTLSYSDKADTLLDKQFISLLNQANQVDEPDDLMEFLSVQARRTVEREHPHLDVEEQEEGGPSAMPSAANAAPKKTVGLFESNDQSKLTYEKAHALILQLRQGIDGLTPEMGLEEAEFPKRLDALVELKERILGLLNGPSMIKNVASSRVGGGGIAALAHEFSPLLLEASYVIRAAKNWLDSNSDALFARDPKLVAPCPLQARAGATIVRAWKKYRAYTAIWSGTKWSSGKLQNTLGGRSNDDPKALEKARGELRKAVKKLKKNEKFDELFSQDEIGTLEHLKNPIAELSAKNIQRLKQQLRRHAIDVIRCDPVELNRERLKEAAQLLSEEHEECHTAWLLARQALEQNPLEYELVVAPPAEPTTMLTPTSLERACSEFQLRSRCESLEKRLNFLADNYESDVVMNGFGLLPTEVDLCAAIIDLPFTIKHATPNWYCIVNDGSLDSLSEFQKKNPNWSSEFSTPGNIKNLGNHGFVFFRVDVGRDPVATRYGDTQIVDDLTVIETDGWISLFDQLKPLSSTTMQRYYDHEGNLIRRASMMGTNDSIHVYEYGKLLAKPNNKRKQATSFAQSQRTAFPGEVWPSMNRECPFTDFVFYGPQIRLGIALSLIYEVRMFIQCGYYRHVMEQFRAVAASDVDRIAFLSRLLSQTFRPEGKYPVALRFTRERVESARVIKPQGDDRWLPDATERPAVMPIVRAIQRRKYLIDAVAQAKKTAEFHREHEREAQKRANAKKENEQRAKAEAREKEFKELSPELERVLKQCEELRKSHPTFFPPEDEEEDTRFKMGI